MADNEANKIKLAWKIEEALIREKINFIETLEKTDRFIEYENLYSTLTKAVPKVIYNWTEDRIDPDKLKRLKDLSKEFSSDQMQEYVAGILAWEYNQPWSYSLVTMSVIKNLTKDDMDIFIKFWSIIIFSQYVFEEMFDASNNTIIILKEKWIDYAEYLYLQQIWLIQSSNTILTIWEWEAEIKILWLIKKKPIIQLIRLSNLTIAWLELYKLIEDKIQYNQDINNIITDILVRSWFERPEDNISPFQTIS